MDEVNGLDSYKKEDDNLKAVSAEVMVDDVTVVI